MRRAQAGVIKIVFENDLFSLTKQLISALVIGSKSNNLIFLIKNSADLISDI